jgi:hypothetical protein
VPDLRLASSGVVAHQVIIWLNDELPRQAKPGMSAIVEFEGR